jgi:CHAT domain-containing protein/tetratricopeptide (TPR) repeat protein
MLSPEAPEMSTERRWWPHLWLIAALAGTPALADEPSAGRTVEQWDAEVERAFDANDLEGAAAASAAALALRLADPTTPARALASNRTDLGTLQLQLERTAQACVTLREAGAAWEAIGDDEGVSVAYNGLGRCLNDDARFSEAIDAFTRSIEATRRAFPDAPERVAVRENNLAGSYEQAGRPAEAAELYQRALTTLEITHGKDHLIVATILNNLGVCLNKQDRFAEAVAAHERALAIRERDGTDQQVAESLSNLASVRRLAGDPAEARRLLERALELDRAAPRVSPLALARRIDNLGVVRREAGDLQGALAAHEEGLALRSAALDATHPEVTTSHMNLANALRDVGRLDEARTHAIAALTAAEARLGPDHPTVADAAHILGSVERDRGDLSAARALYERSLTLRAKAQGARSDGVAAVLDLLGILAMEEGDPTRALALHEEALAIRVDAFGARHPLVGDSYHNLALAAEARGDLATARRYLTTSLDLWREALGDRHPNVARSLNGLGVLLIHQGDDAGAVLALRDALALRLDLYGPAHLDVATTQNNLAAALSGRGDLDEARVLFEASLQTRVQVLGDDHPTVARARNNLGTALMEAGRADLARPQFEAALAASSRAFGLQHPDVASSLYNLGDAALATGDAAEAEERFGDAADAWRASLGADHPKVAVALTGLARAQAASGRSPREALDAALAISTARVDLVGALSDHEGAAYLASMHGTLGAWLHAFQEPSDAEAAWGHVLQWKGVVTGAMIDRMDVARSGDDVEASAELARTRSALARLVYADSSDVDADARARAVRELTDKKGALERQLGVAVRDVSPSDVCARLPADATWIDVLRTPLPTEPHYVVFVVTKGCAAQRVDLGPAAPIDDAVASWRSALSRGSLTTTARGERLAALIWAPIAPYVASGPLWISPDSALAALPWAALPDGGGYLVERHVVRMVPVARAALRPPVVPGPRLVTVGGVDFQAVAPTAGSAPSRAAACLDQDLRPLPGSATESALVARSWPRRWVTRLSGAAATEDAVASAASDAGVLHVATHGFFASDACRSSLSGAADGAGMNPMLLAGLALAGSGAAYDPAARDDGILTAEEVAGLDLQHTGLVLLSACDTALGVTRPGDGVMGLQRGFAIAGAGAVVMSLWGVDDDATVALMASLTKGARRDDFDAAEALRAAQLRAIANARRRNDGAATRHWAAWVASGT